jgi:Holin of 3TMs, for gene-transfer release
MFVYFAAVEPAMAQAILTGMTSYLAAIPEPLYALFGTGYLGYTAARQWGKVKGVDK